MSLHPTIELLTNVIYLKDGGANTATGFLISVESREYVLTARHFALYLNDADYVEIFRAGKWEKHVAHLVGHCEGNVDITAFALDKTMIKGEPIDISHADDKYAVGDEVYFAGFPLGLYIDVPDDFYGGYPIPFAKFGRLSAIGFGGERALKLPGSRPFFFDGMNNVGSSGSPVVARNQKDELRIIAVVSSYYFENVRQINQNGSNTPNSQLATNAGIFLGHQSAHARKIIELNPIGPRKQ